MVHVSLNNATKHTARIVHTFTTMFFFVMINNCTSIYNVNSSPSTRLFYFFCSKSQRGDNTLNISKWKCFAKFLNTSVNTTVEWNFWSQPLFQSLFCNKYQYIFKRERFTKGELRDILFQNPSLLFLTHQSNTKFGETTTLISAKNYYVWILWILSLWTPFPHPYI